MLHYFVNVSNGDLKKLIFFVLLFSFTTSFGQVKLEALVGYNDVNMSNTGMLPFKNYDYEYSSSIYSSINSFLVGAGAEIPLGRKWFFEPALLYFGNGTHISEKASNPGIEFNMELNIHLYYLHIPVSILYKTDLVKSVKVFGGAGLYFARGLWGTEKGQFVTEGGGILIQAVDTSIKFRTGTPSTSTYPTFNPYDLGYTILAGIEWKQFKLTTSISNGLIKAYSGYNNNLWNCAFSVYLTYQFASIPKNKK
jgi:hypothetical protein